MRIGRLKALASGAEVLIMRNKTRFWIFQRDGHRCVYCGASTDQARLEVDHVVPKAEGGTDDDWNLVASCEGCNRAKWAHGIRWDRIPMYVKENLRLEFSVDDSLGEIAEPIFGLSFRWDLPPCAACGSHYTRLGVSAFGSVGVHVECSDCGKQSLTHNPIRRNIELPLC